MVSYCCVSGCKNNSDSACESISFHEFPSEPEQRYKWLEAIGRPLWDPPSYMCICSEHFNIDQINQDGSRNRVKMEAHPVILPISANTEASNAEVCRICLAIDVKMFSLQKGMLKLCIENLTGLKDKYSIVGLPQFVCYECGAHLLKYYQLMEKSMIAQTTLLEILEVHGQITKHLVKLKDRKQLRLQSTLGYPEPSAVIALVNNNSNNDTREHDGSERKCSKYKIKRIKGICSEGMKKSNKNKHRTKTTPEQIIEQDVTENKAFSHIDVTLKSETDENIEHCDQRRLDAFEDTNIKGQNVSNKAASENYTEINETLKIEFEGPDYYKTEKSDSDFELCSNYLDLDVKSESSEHDDSNKSKSQIQDKKKCDNLNIASKPVNRNLKPKRKKCNDNVVIKDAIEENVTDDESSDDEDLLSLKNNAYRNKHSNNNDSTTSKKKAPARKKKPGDKEPPGESAIGKLKCYKIVNLSLQDQIEEWKKENEQSIHTRDEVFTCEVCTKKFLRKKAYEQHLSYHKPSRGDVECPVCRERFQSKTRLNAHTTRTHAKRYECTKCPKVLYNLTRARRHELQHSGQVYSCAQCGYSTRHRSAVWEHARRQHAHAHHCARCGHAFINAKGLAQHRAIAHPDQEEPKETFPCVQCNIVFHSEGALRVHQFTSKLHDSPKEPAPVDQALKLTCKRCGATFAKRRDLWAHAEKDHNWVSRPTLRKRGVPLDRRTCEHCDKEIKNRFEYWCHLRREHPNLKHTYRRVVTAVCDKCGKGFNNASLLKIHSLSHGSATHACAHCPRVFHDRHALARHAYSHTPDRPYPCSQCDRAFKLKGNLDRHMRTHTGETPYECSFCGKKFKYWSSMNEHEKHMHQKIPWPPRDRRTAGSKKNTDHGRI